jgi:hypothetical protein
MDCGLFKVSTRARLLLKRKLDEGGRTSKVEMRESEKAKHKVGST